MGLPGPDREHLARLEPKLQAVTSATLVWRVYRAGGRHPRRWNELRHFGPVASRFDHHLEDPEGQPHEQERGVLYAAPDFLSTLAEAFQAGRHIDVHAERPRVSAFHLASPIRLLDLSSRFATQAGCHQGIHSSPLRRRTRAWSRAFYDTWPEVQGLLYRSKMAVDLPAYVFFERMVSSLPARPLVDLDLADPLLQASIRAIAVEIGYSVD